MKHGSQTKKKRQEEMITAENVAASMSFSSLTVNAMVDKAELNNPSELNAIKTLCEKMRPNLLLY